MARTKILNAKVEPELKEAVDMAAVDFNMTTSSFVESLLKNNKDVKFIYQNILKKKISQKK